MEVPRELLNKVISFITDAEISSDILFTYLSENQMVATFTIFLIVSFFIIWGVQLSKNVKRGARQRKEIEKLAFDLKEANLRLKELDTLKTEFVSIASHQLRSPLSAVKGYASMLLEGSFGTLTVGAQEAVGRIFTSSSFMARSVDDFLNVSRIELGKIKYVSTKFDICKLIELIIDEQKAFAEDKKLKLVYLNKTENKNCHMRADVGKIKQILSNIIDNAVKYTTKGSITIILNSNDDKRKILIDVIDTGMGISAETIQKLFQKFVRSDKANEVNVVGTGLGLYVAKKLAEAQGGKIWVTSPGEGRGSTFHIELPNILSVQSLKKS